MFLKQNKKFTKFFATICLVAVFFNMFPSPQYVLEILAKLQQQKNIVDKIYLAKQNKNVVDNFKMGVPVAKASTDPDQSEFMIDVGPVNGKTTVSYVYASFFNPAGSGKTAVIKRVAVKANAVTTANYVNLSLRRITASSAGTQIANTNIPKKNSDAALAVSEIRHSGPVVTFAGIADSRILGQPMPGGAGQIHSYRDITFGVNDEKIVLQPGEGLAVYQEAAGDLDQRIRTYFEWDEVASAPIAKNEFLFAFPRVEIAATANYAYNSFFNPAASGKTAVVKRVWFGTETCDTTATYTNNISLRRTTAASGGTAIVASNIPKKNTSSANSVMDFRRSNPTVSLVGSAEARLGLVTPCGAAGQPNGFQQINFQDSDEELILQPGEGLALISETTGDVDQLSRMIIEWQELVVASTPTSEGEYMFAFHKISNEAVAPPINTSFYTFFNPVASGKTAVIKKIGIRNNSDTTSTYASFNWRRLSAASGGTLISSGDVPKKHSSTGNTAMELRSCGTACASAISATYSGTSDSRLLSVNGSGAVGQVIGMRELSFGNNENLILKPGEGIGFYIDVLAGDIDHYIKTYVEWGEETVAPVAQNEYVLSVGPVNGSTVSGYNYASFFNPIASGKTTIIKKVSLRIDTISTAVYIPMTLRRSSSASGGTQITSANIPKKNTSSNASAMDIRRTGVTVGLAGNADSRLINVQTAGTTGAATAPSTNGYREFSFENDEQIILQPGEGVSLYQELAGDADFRVKILFEWEEVAFASTPSTQNEFLMTTGPVNGNVASGYVYSSLFNPSTSGKNYIVKRLEIRVNRVGTLVAPGYVPITIKKTSSASGGTTVLSSNIPKKHSGTLTSTAQINHSGPTVSFSESVDARLLSVTAPGIVRQYGDYENIIIEGDELILQQGEGLALYQEAASGDSLMRFQMTVVWSEVDAPSGGGSLSVDIVDSIGSTILSPVASFIAAGFDWSAQISNGTLGVASQKIRVSNTTTTPTWTLSISATANTDLWTSGGNTYDFNGSAATGRLQMNASTATVTPQSGCATTGVSKSAAAYFIQGTQDAVNLIVAGPTAETNCYWDITGITMTQDIPALQNTGNYALNLVVTAI
ncbi:MAG: hypothetical protein US57_C0004G0011 [Candidatus Moranbacteria bacterium GW2011_GWC2_37_73]|nr:MAG: hypothetical protein UR95_C0002G0089 [Parcubacteria group bacterium GW2011_GWC1_36_108]KKQ01068.1 MAG: hypothetical protein US09_C0003G0068 [Candidatus Moranbacteria bacterium GW2011_GWD1_36_198]KKQ02470.1 MAG: hypothetical protein US10_C0001G0068 [Candidatus Moranbacteria bacterium GW2011_GWD2_36_198]KKQ40128.1 MAG: hypothetical protein US57_C0004G0011 [Candidatus Moranbacteria bacterium GW2011_GWC2_37_73]HAS00252.1 hypothetical protein [Candidatus Moranbacteria bacterium]